MTEPRSTYRLTNSGVAAMLGIRPDTWRGMVKMGQTPPPDGIEPVSGYRWWYRETIEVWNAQRPGQGSRSTPRALTRARERRQAARRAS